MLNILDSLSVPSPQQITDAKAQGYAAWFGYFGGPSAAGIWPDPAFAEVRQGGLTAGGFWVGLGDSVTAARSAQAVPFPTGSLLGHDVETGPDVAGLSDAVAQAFVSAFHAVGYRLALYGLPSLVTKYGHWYDAGWIAGGSAYRTGTPVPTSPTDQFGRITPIQGWQWYGTHDFNGIGVDSTIADPTFLTAPENEMTIDMARLQVWPWYVNWCGRVAQQSEVDYWAGRLVAGENYELVVSEFYASPEAVAYRSRTIPVTTHTHGVSATLVTTTSPPQ